MVEELITSDVLEEFKERMKLGNGEDANLISILSASYEDLVEKCGEYSLENNRFKELVFERSRYVYNDALEYFNINFQSQINALGVDKAMEGIVLDESI